MYPYDGPTRLQLDPTMPQAAPPPPEMDYSALLKEMVSLGQLDPKEAALLQQQKQAEALRGTPMPGGINAGGMFIAQPLSAIGAGLERYAGGRRGQEVSRQQADLQAQRQRAHEAAMGAVGSLPSGGMPGTPEALAQEEASNRLASILAGGDKTTQALGKTLSDRTEQKARHALERALATFKPYTAATLPDGTTRVLEGQSGATRYEGTPNSKPVAATGAGKLGGMSDDDKAWERFVNKTNAGIQTSRSVLGMDQATADRVDRAITLIKSKPYRTPQEVNELGVALAGVVTGGNMAARQTIEDISYKTLGMHLAEGIQWLTAHPQDSRMGEFVSRIKDVLEAEKKQAGERIRQKVKQHATGMQELARRKAAVAIPYFRGLGLSDSDLMGLGLIEGATSGEAPATPAAPAPTLDDLRKKYGGK